MKLMQYLNNFKQNYDNLWFLELLKAFAAPGTLVLVIINEAYSTNIKDSPFKKERDTHCVYIQEYNPN